MSLHAAARPKNLTIPLDENGEAVPRPKQRIRRHPSCFKPGGSAALRHDCTCLTITYAMQLADRDADGAYLHRPGCPCRKPGDTR